MQAARSSREARIWGVMGASGTGKGLWIKKQLRALRPPRLVIWDFLDEYGEFARPSKSVEAIRKAMLAAGEAGPLRVRYLPRGQSEKDLRREFESVCSLAYAWEGCTFIAEELANVTTPGWAPAAWRRMTTSGRHAGVHIIGTSQTPALVDKTFLGNCTLIHCSALREHAHRQAVARSMDVEIGELAKLKPLEWIERDWSAGELRHGRVEIPRKRAAAKPVALAPATGTGRGEPEA